MDLLHFHFQGDCNSSKVQFNGSRSQTLALKCLEKAPTLHSMFSHIIRERAYTFLLDQPHLFQYFGIFDEKMERSEAMWFLNRVKESSSA